MSELKIRTALITGASFGIGEAFARQLAAEGTNLVITARSHDRLEALAGELRSKHGIEVNVIAADLDQASAPQQIFDETEGRGLQIDLLINNAGFGAVGDFIDLTLDKQMEMIRLNIDALVSLTWLFLQPMAERRAGAIMQVASTAAFQGIPYFAVYAATKAFVLSFGDALSAECGEYGVRVMTLCPGPTESNFQTVAGTSNFKRGGRPVQTAAEVVEIGLKALKDGQPVSVPGFANRLMVVAQRFIPRKMVIKFASGLYRSFSKRAQ